MKKGFKIYKEEFEGKEVYAIKLGKILEVKE